jgi:hypothetical protein
MYMKTDSTYGTPSVLKAIHFVLRDLLLLVVSV